MISFLTVLSTVWVIIYVLGFISVVYEASKRNLTPRFHPAPSIGFLVAVSFLISKLF